MSRYLFFIVFLLSSSALSAQTIIDLKPGGGVRAKTVDDYKEEMKMAERLREDSLAYVDNLRRAFNALHADSLAEAEALFTEALKLRPTAPGNHVLRYNLAQIERARGQYAQAVNLLSDIIKKNPHYYDARLARAEMYLQQEKAREAIEDADVLLNSDVLKYSARDLLPKARFVRAAARYRLRYYVEARADLHQLLKENPRNENAQILDALTLQKMGQPKEALNRLNLIVAAFPQSVEALATRAGIEVELGMDGLARADYDALIALQPAETSFYIERAKVHIRLNDKPAARRDLDRVLELGVPRGVVQPLYNLTREKP